jgi:ectoine hydroxylase-related dioxygenase (phytanoyl-CoA dioxygenase family)
MEDIHDDAGPLEYYPGSHRWPIITNAMIGQRRWDRRSVPAQEPYQTVWHELVAASGIPVDRFRARKGQALIWAANLLHGGSPQRDPARTRWSQVTHYYFAECVYYTPAYSDEALGRFDVRSIKNIATDEQEPNIFLDEKIKPRSRRRKWYRRLIGR